jgi:hypothetical protein
MRHLNWKIQLEHMGRAKRRLIPLILRFPAQPGSVRGASYRVGAMQRLLVRPEPCGSCAIRAFSCTIVDTTLIDLSLATEEQVCK